MKILITGVAGFIGFSITKKLLKDKKNTIFGLDNFDNYYSTSYKKKRISQITVYKNFSFFRLDITNKKKLNFFLNNNKFDIIMHFAAQAGVRYSLKNPKKYKKVNIDGFKNLLDGLIKNKPKKIIYASSSSVYGNTKTFPTNETSKLLGKNIYAKTKINNEIMALKYKKKYNFNIHGLRFFTVYGEWGRPDMFLFKLLKSYKKNKVFLLNNYGKHSRDFTYIKDVTEILSRLIKKNKLKFDIANICNSNPVNIKYICDNFSNKYKFYNIKLVKKHTADVLNTYGSNKKIKKIVGFKNFTSFDVGFKNTIKWYLKQSIYKF